MTATGKSGYAGRARPALRSGGVELLVGPGRGRELDIERLPVPDAAPQELGPVRNLRERIRGFGQEPPELGMMPAEIVAGAVPMPPDPFPQTKDLVDQLVARECRELLVARHHYDESSSFSTSPMILVALCAGRGSPPSASATSAANASTEGTPPTRTWRNASPLAFGSESEATAGATV